MPTGSTRVALAVALLVAGCGDTAHHSATTTTPPPVTDASTTLPTAPSGTGPPSSTTRTTPTTPTTTPTTAPATAVFGTVTAGPTCPVERPGQPCPPSPVHGTVQALDDGGQVVGQAPTDAEGRYDLPLAAGTYTLHVAVGAAFPRCPDAPATAITGHRTRVDLTCDTGLR